MRGVWQKLAAWLGGRTATTGPARSYTFPLADFPDGQGTPLNVGGKRLAVFHLGERVFVIENSCSHNRSPLAGGTVSGTVVTCRTHRARFSLETGQAVGGPTRRPVRTYPVTVTEGRVVITVS